MQSEADSHHNLSLFRSPHANTSTFNNFTDLEAKPVSTDNSILEQDEVFLPWKNPHNLITFETFALIEHVLLCYVNPVIFCVGVPTNVLNCVVFARQGLRDRMNLCLFCLSLVDLCYVTIYYCASGLYCFVELVRPDLVQWWKWTGHKHVLGLYRGFLLCSGCLTMIISVERCVCVLWPLRAASLMTARGLGLVILCVVDVVHLLCLVFPLKVDVQLVNDFVTNTSEYKLVPSVLYLDDPVVFDVIEMTIVMNVIPLFNFVVVGLATIVTVVQLRRMMAWRSNTSTAKDSVMTRQQVALVKMLVTVSTLFILTFSPFVALSITSLAEPEFFLNRRYNNLFLATHAVQMQLGMMNSSINFFIYTCRSSKFREELKRLFCPPGCSKVVEEDKQDLSVSYRTREVSLGGQTDVRQ